MNLRVGLTTGLHVGSERLKSLLCIATRLVMRHGNAVYRILTVVVLYIVGIVLPFYIVFLIVTHMPVGIWSGEIVRAIII